MRLTKQQRLDILAAMVEEARVKTAQGLDVRVVQQHVQRVRDDMRSAYQAGVMVKSVQESQE